MKEVEPRWRIVLRCSEVAGIERALVGAGDNGSGGMGWGQRQIENGEREVFQQDSFPRSQLFDFSSVCDPVSFLRDFSKDIVFKGSLLHLLVCLFIYFKVALFIFCFLNLLFSYCFLK